jgi:hypothetical protein
MLASFRVKVAFASISVLLASGCSFTQVGRLYLMNTGQSAKLEAHDPVISRAHVEAQLPNGSTCHGGLGPIDAPNARQMTDSQILFSENADASVAVLRCSSGEVLRCAFAGRPGSGLSYGICQDQGDAEYAVVF